MNNQIFHLPESISNQTRNAFLVISVYLIGSIITGGYLISQAIQTPSWQLWTAIIALTILAMSGIAAFVLVRRGRLELGVWFMMIGSYIAGITLVIVVSGMSVLILVSAIFFSSMVAIQTLRSRQAVMFIAGVAVGVIVLFIDFFIKTERISIPAFQNLINFFVPAILFVFGVVILRQFRHYSLRTKLIIVLTVVVMAAVGIIGFITNRNSEAALTDSADQKLLGAASQTATRMDDLITINLNIIRTEAESTEELGTFLSLRASGQSTDAEAADLAKTLYSFAQRDPQSITSYALLDAKGIDVADTFKDDIGVDKSNREYFKTPMQTGQPYVSAVTLSPTRPGDTDLYFSGPVHDASGKIVGVLRFSYSTKGLKELITQANGLAGKDSFAVLLDENYIRLAHGTTPDLVFKSVVPLDPALLTKLQAAGRMPAGTPEQLSSNLPDLKTALQNMDAQPIFASASAALGGSTAETAVVRMKTQPWIVYFRQSQSVFLAPVEAQTRLTLMLTVIIILLSTGAAAGLAQVVVAPITHLTATATKVAAGDLNVEARVESADEIGTLAKAFNSMTAQLRDFIGTLEARVAERTRNLELAAEVGRTVSQVRALDVMLTDAAELIRKQFDLYYVQVYLVSPSRTTLVLQSGTGKVGAELIGRGHNLPLNNNSINGRAAIEKHSVVIADTTASATFKPNPLLPNTRSEMAVPLMIGEKVVGVLDMQSENVGSLNQEVLSAFEALAGQLAIAIQNSVFLAEVEQARTEVETHARRLTHANYIDYLDAIHKPEELGFVYRENKIIPLDETEQTQVAENANAVVAPISVTGEELGTLVVEMEGQSPISRTTELINTVARQVAQQIEALRLLDSAERYRAEAELASRRLTREGWQEYASKSDESVSYIYDLKEVRARNNNGDEQVEDTGYTLPLKVRDETVGKLVIQGLHTDDKESLNLASAVAERLGTHIESLRLTRQTEEALETTRKFGEREQALRQITSAVRGSTDPAIILRTAARELGTLLGRKTIVRMATAREAQASPADHVEEANANNGNKPVSPAESQNAIGGDK